MKEEEIPVIDEHGNLLPQGLFGDKVCLSWDEFQQLMMKHLRAKDTDLQQLRVVLGMYIYPIFLSFFISIFLLFI